MGKKLEALKWALTTRPKNWGMENNLKWEVALAKLPQRIWRIVMGIAALIGVLAILTSIFVNQWLAIVVGVTAAAIGYRAFIKLMTDWVDEHYEIIVREKAT